jgi:hypothetical protein
MSPEISKIMEALRALSKDATMPEDQQVPAAEQAIKTWLAQTSDPAERQAKLWELDDEVAAEEVDDFWDGLLAHIDQELTTLVAPGQGPKREEPR